MNLLLGAITEGFILTPLALGLFISFRIYDRLDLTVDGSFGVGAAVVAALLVHGVSPVLATGIGTVAGVAAGATTGVLHTRLGVSAALAGVLVTTALYSVTLFVLGGGNLSLAATGTLVTVAEQTTRQALGLPASFTLLGNSVSSESLATMTMMGLVAGALTLGLAGLLQTELGLAMRAAGRNPQMARSTAVDVDQMILLGLGLSNGVIALSGALFAQYQGFANIQMGVGAVVTGLATLMLGEAIGGRRSLGRPVAAALIGAVVYRLLIALAIRAGLNPNALKLVTALLVLVVLLLPKFTPMLRRVPPRTAHSHG